MKEKLQLQAQLHELFQDKLDLEHVKIERVHKIGQVGSSDKRTIATKLSNFEYRLKLICTASLYYVLLFLIYNITYISIRQIRKTVETDVFLYMPSKV